MLNLISSKPAKPRSVRPRAIIRYPRSVIERWRVHYHNNALVDRPSSRERQLEAENEKLRAKVGELVMQMDHLKNCKPGFSDGKTRIHR